MMETAIIVGVGAEHGLGAELAKRFARGGLHVLPAGRTQDRLEALAAGIRHAGGTATPVVTDTTCEADVARLFDEAERIGGKPPVAVLYNAGNNAMVPLADMTAEFFEGMWRVACFGGFLVGREATRRMARAGRGTVIFTGATGSIRSRPPFVAFASAKAGLRAIAQGMARELGPQGVHVAHVIIDGGIAGDRIEKGLPAFAASKGDDGLLDLGAIADAYWHLHTQHRTAWSFEIDLRPFKEPF